MSNTTEAAFSVNFRLIDPKGIELQLTMRSNSADAEEAYGFLANRDALIEELLNSGYEPSQGFPGKPAIKTDSKTPKCGCGMPRVTRSGDRADGSKWTGLFCAKKKCEVVWQE